MAEYRLEAFQVVRELRGDPNLNLKSITDAVCYIADTFGFKPDPHGDGLDNWREFRLWAQSNKITLKNVKGPHAHTLLKVLATQCKNVSKQCS